MPQSPLLTRFCNEKARVMFDMAESCYETARRFQSEYASSNIGAEVSDLANLDVIDDGSATDGRKALTVRELKALDTAMGQLITWFETTTINALSVEDIVKTASVNGGPRF